MDIVTFQPAINGGVRTWFHGAWSFPERSGLQPEVGDEYEVVAFKPNYKGNVYFLTLGSCISTKIERDEKVRLEREAYQQVQDFFIEEMKYARIILAKMQSFLPKKIALLLIVQNVSIRNEKGSIIPRACVWSNILGYNIKKENDNFTAEDCAFAIKIEDCEGIVREHLAEWTAKAEAYVPPPPKSSSYGWDDDAGGTYGNYHGTDY